MLLAASSLIDKVGGRYFEDCEEAAVVTRRPAGYPGVAWYALDAANADRLWETALGLLKSVVYGPSAAMGMTSTPSGRRVA